MAIEPLTGSAWRPAVIDPFEYLEYLLAWPNPVLEPIEIPDCFKADPESPEWLKELLRKTWEFYVGLYPIPVDRRFQFDGGYSSPGPEAYGLDLDDISWTDLIHDHVGVEADD